ncbi:MAG TPA: SDR family oxidoreductase [Thermomicrobiales bacterium]|nr:SDR family oxidoreductase [Thermomicrobiales bacterium]
MRILVTGGAGFIGSHIATRLMQQGERVRILDNFSHSTPANLDHIINDIELVEGDLRSEDDVSRAMDGIELVYHEGALGSVPRSIDDPRTSFDVNAMGTLNVLNAARRAGTRRVVYASSSSVYGNTPTLPKREEMSPAPISPYAVSKLAAEKLCVSFWHTYGLETVALRYFNVFGPRQNPDSQYAAVMPKFLRAYTNGQQPTIFGDGEQSRSFTYIDNVVDGNLLAGSAPDAAGKVMNLASDTNYSVNLIARNMAELLGVEFDPTYEPPRPGDVRDSLADIAIAREVLGWEPKVDLDEGLRRTVADFVATHGLSTTTIQD